MAYALVSDLYQSFDNATEAFAIENISNVLEVATPIVALALTLSLIIRGLFIMVQPAATGEPLGDLIGQFVKYVMVIGVAGAGGIYQSDIASMALNFPDEISSSIYMGGEATNVDKMGAVIDQAAAKGLDLAKHYAENIEFSGEGLTSIYLFVHILVCTFVMCGVGAALILMAKVLLAIAVAFGPVFIFALLFSSTKRLFTPWVGSVVNYGLLVVLIAAVFSFMATFYGDIMNSAISAVGGDPASSGSVGGAHPGYPGEFPGQNTGGTGVPGMLSTVLSSGLMTIITLVVMFKLPSLAASWTSGIASSLDLPKGRSAASASRGGGSGGRGSGGGSSESGSGSGEAGQGGGSGGRAAGAARATANAAKTAGGAAGKAAQKVLSFARQ